VRLWDYWGLFSASERLLTVREPTNWRGRRVVAVEPHSMTRMSWETRMRLTLPKVIMLVLELGRIWVTVMEDWAEGSS
jgi:hypothetical protein